MRVILLIMTGLSWLCAAEVFTDPSTGLMWQDNRDAKSIEKDWEGAKAYCENLSLEGQSDWRLPAIKELQSIVDITKYDPAIKAGFKNTASNYYWSSSACVDGSSYAWSVDFEYGDTRNGDKSNSIHVRCVRGRQ